MDSIKSRLQEIRQLVKEAARDAQLAKLPGAAYPAFEALSLLDRLIEDINKPDSK